MEQEDRIEVFFFLLCNELVNLTNPGQGYPMYLRIKIISERDESNFYQRFTSSNSYEENLRDFDEKKQWLIIIKFIGCISIVVERSRNRVRVEQSSKSKNRTCTFPFSLIPSPDRKSSVLQDANRKPARCLFITLPPRSFPIIYSD